MRITFYGGVGEVTGSKHLVEIGGMRILLDCGFHQGHRKEARELNSVLPFDPASIDAVVLSHAHLDHCGMLPLLVKNGYKGKIFATSATKDVAEWILKDAAHIQMSDAAHLAKHRSEGAHLAQPLYTIDDIPAVMDRFVTVPYARNSGEWFSITIPSSRAQSRDPSRDGSAVERDSSAEPALSLSNGVGMTESNVRLKFYDAGHILGSAVTVLEAPLNRFHNETLVFTGDLGRNGAPLIPDPEYIHETAAVLLLESTYGSRVHQDFAAAKKRLKELVAVTIERRSKLIVPAFALGRTQELVYLLHELTDAGEIPHIPVFVDSPLAGHVTDVFRAHTDDFDVESWKEFGEKNEAPLAFPNLVYVESTEESKRLNSLPGPCIIIASSGMCEGGRILHHLRNNISNPASIILFTGYQAANTLGRRILEGEKRVRVYDEYFEVRAKIEKLNELSAHADRNELCAYAEHVKGLKKVFLVHGEYSQAAGLKSFLEERHPEWQISIPERGETVDL